MRQTPSYEAQFLNTQERLLAAFATLVAEGRQILNEAGFRGDNYNVFPPQDRYIRFRTEALNLVRRACGDDSDHYKELRRIAESKDMTSNSYYTSNCVGALEAAERDFKSGLLFDLRALVAAELLGDFLDQAEALLQAGYHVPAASLAGAVLEDTLRKLATSKGLVVPAKTTIDGLNIALAKAGVFDLLVQKRITALADIRNNADHGHFGKFTPDDVEDMVKWLVRFTADYLS